MKENAKPGMRSTESDAPSKLASRRPGPRTPQGKDRSRYNAVGRGIFANMVLTGGPFHEDEKNYHALLKALQRSFAPTDALEHLLVEKLAILWLRLSRVYQADAEIAPLLFEKVRKSLAEGHDPGVTTYFRVGTEVVAMRKELAPELLLKYEAAIDRGIHRVLDCLEHLQRSRRGEPVPPTLKVDLGG